MVQRIKKQRSWRVQFVDTDGIRKSRTFAKKDDAAEFAEQVRQRRQRFQSGLSVPTDSVLFYGMAAKFLRHHEKKVARSSFESDKSRMQTGWLKKLGHMPVKDIRRVHIIEVLQGLSEKGLSAASVNLHRALIHGFFEFALDMEKVEFNPVTRINPLPATKQARPHGHWEHLEDILAYMRAMKEEEDEVYGVAAAIYVYSGVRATEATGLQWKDIDWVKGLIWVRRIIEKCSNSVQERTKTDKLGLGVPIPLFSPLREILRVWRANCWFASEEHFILTSATGTHIRYEYMRRAHVRAVKKAGLPPVTIHGIRSTFSSLAEKRGFQKSDIQRMLRHSNISTTEKYTKVDTTLIRGLTEKGEKLGFTETTGESPARLVHSKTAIKSG